MSERPLAHQVPLFVVVGVAATAAHVVAALAARELAGVEPLAANVVGWVCAVGVSYLGNARVTFRRRVAHGPQVVRFVVASLTGLAVTQAITWLVAQRLGLPFAAAMAAVGVVTPAVSFVLSRLWVFRAAG